MRRPAILLALSLAIGSLAVPGRAAAYDHQVTLDVGAGWGFAPALEMGPNHGPAFGLSTGIGFDDTWGLGVVAGWAVHPAFTDSSEPLQVGLFGVEALYYLDIFVVVPFFGLGVDALTTFDGNEWRVDFAAHARVSVDWLVSREVALGLDVRPYILVTALELDPIYITAQLRLSVLLDY